MFLHKIYCPKVETQLETQKWETQVSVEELKKPGFQNYSRTLSNGKPKDTKVPHFGNPWKPVGDSKTHDAIKVSALITIYTNNHINITNRHTTLPSYYLIVEITTIQSL